MASTDRDGRAAHGAIGHHIEVDDGAFAEGARPGVLTQERERNERAIEAHLHPIGAAKVEAGAFEQQDHPVYPGKPGEWAVGGDGRDRHAHREARARLPAPHQLVRDAPAVLPGHRHAVRRPHDRHHAAPERGHSGTGALSDTLSVPASQDRRVVARRTFPLLVRGRLPATRSTT